MSMIVRTSSAPDESVKETRTEIELDSTLSASQTESSPGPGVSLSRPPATSMTAVADSIRTSTGNDVGLRSQRLSVSSSEHLRMLLEYRVGPDGARVEGQCPHREERGGGRGSVPWSGVSRAGGP